MIKKINVFFLVFMLTCFSLQIIVHGLSMAAFTENNYASVNRDETAQFFIFFWNPEDEPSPVRLKATQTSEELVVIIKPDDFMLNSSLVTEFPAEKDRNYVNTEQGLMMTTPVKVLVKVPRAMEPGTYDMVVTATAGNPSEAVSTFLEKNFKFTVNVTSLAFFESLVQTGKDITSGITDAFKGITGMAPAGPATDFTLLIILIIVLAFFVWFIRFR